MSEVELKVGDKLRDNDPRMQHRSLLTIVRILPNGVLADDLSGRCFALLRRRIHTDGKPRRGGFDLVRAEA